MKKFLVMLMLALSTIGYSQNSTTVVVDSTHQVNSTDSVTLSAEQWNKVLNMFDQLVLLDSINTIQQEQIRVLTNDNERLVRLLTVSKEIDTLRVNQLAVYKEHYDAVRPKWYDNKFVWFLLGFGTSYGGAQIYKATF